MNEENKVLTNESIVSKIYGENVAIDISKSPDERIVGFVKKINEPNIFHMNDYEVELAWSNTARTIQDCMRELLCHV